MAIFKRRDQVVVFRVTSEEHAQLQKACEASGGRNLSDFVRLTVLNRVQGRPAARTSLAVLEKRLSDLEATHLQSTKCAQPVPDAPGDGGDELA